MREFDNTVETVLGEIGRQLESGASVRRRHARWRVLVPANVGREPDAGQFAGAARAGVASMDLVGLPMDELKKRCRRSAGQACRCPRLDGALALQLKAGETLLDAKSIEKYFR